MNTQSQIDPLSIALIGCGKMGSAMLRGWLSAGMTHAAYVVEPGHLPPELAHNPVIKHLHDANALPITDVLVLAVKPQSIAEVCAALRPDPSTLVLSIAAGQKLSNFEKHFGETHPIIRAMPNTPAAIAKGMTVLVGNKAVTRDHHEMATQLLSATGHVEWVKDEELMDAVTALSGSGPAYVFHLIEVMTQAGIDCGLDADFARSLARQTVIGSAALAEVEHETPAEHLRKNVTSPGGTTEAALNVLMNGEVQNIFTRALAAATARSKELSK